MKNNVQYRESNEQLVTHFNNRNTIDFSMDAA